jgi:hypothetical protein
MRVIPTCCYCVLYVYIRTVWLRHHVFCGGIKKLSRTRKMYHDSVLLQSNVSTNFLHYKSIQGEFEFQNFFFFFFLFPSEKNSILHESASFRKKRFWLQISTGICRASRILMLYPLWSCFDVTYLQKKNDDECNQKDKKSVKVTNIDNMLPNALFPNVCLLQHCDSVFSFLRRSVTFHADRPNDSFRSHLQRLPRLQDVGTPSNNTRNTYHLGSHPSKY